MTLKEISRKYEIPYNVVYESSYKVTPLTYSRTEREYPEEDVIKEVKHLVGKRIELHRKLLNNMLDIYSKLE